MSSIREMMYTMMSTVGTFLSKVELCFLVRFLLCCSI